MLPRDTYWYIALIGTARICEDGRIYHVVSGQLTCRTGLQPTFTITYRPFKICPPQFDNYILQSLHNHTKKHDSTRLHVHTTLAQYLVCESYTVGTNLFALLKKDNTFKWILSRMLFMQLLFSNTDLSFLFITYYVIIYTIQCELSMSSEHFIQHNPRCHKWSNTAHCTNLCTAANPVQRSTRQSAINRITWTF